MVVPVTCTTAALAMVPAPPPKHRQKTNCRVLFLISLALPQSQCALSDCVKTLHTLDSHFHYTQHLKKHTHRAHASYQPKM